MFARVLKFYFIGNLRAVWLCSDSEQKQILMLLPVWGKGKKKKKQTKSSQQESHQSLTYFRKVSILVYVGIFPQTPL